MDDIAPLDPAATRSGYDMVPVDEVHEDSVGILFLFGPGSAYIPVVQCPRGSLVLKIISCWGDNRIMKRNRGFSGLAPGRLFLRQSDTCSEDNHLLSYSGYGRAGISVFSIKRAAAPALQLVGIKI